MVNDGALGISYFHLCDGGLRLDTEQMWCGSTNNTELNSQASEATRKRLR